MNLNLTRQEVYKLIIELYNEIEYRIQYEKSQFLSAGYIQEDERVTYEHIDMDDLEDRLIIVLANIHQNISLNLFLQDEKKIVLKICLAAICQIIKSKYYLNSIGNTYRELTGLEFNSKMYYGILETAFGLEGILPSNWDEIKGQSFRFKDVLIHEAGIPASLAKKLVAFFLLYWKYMRNIPNEKFFYNSEEYRSKSNFHFETNDYNNFWSLYEELSGYPQKFFKVMTQLEKICKFLENNEYEEEDLDNPEVINGINQKIGFNIYTLLPRKDSLSFLYKQVLNKIAPGKLMRILSRKPREFYITTPSESRVKVSNYREYEFGKHMISGVEYTVVPDTAISIDNLISWKFDEIIYNDEKIGYRSYCPFEVKFGKNRINKALPLYSNGIIKGYFWYGQKLDGLPLFINKKLIAPLKPIYYNKYLRYYWDENLRSYGFRIKLTDIRMYLPNYRNRHIEMTCEHSKGVENFVLDRIGCREIEKVQFIIDNNWDGSHLEVKLNLKELNAVETIDAFTVEYGNSLLCFNTLTKSHVPPKEYAFGVDKLILFIPKTINSIIEYDEEIATLKKYPSDLFDIYSITWQKKDVSLSFNIGNDRWIFKQPLRFYLANIQGDANTEDEQNESEYEQYNDLSSLTYEVYTNISIEELLSKVYLLVFLNDKTHKEIKLSKVLRIFNNKIVLQGQKIIDSLWLNKEYIGSIILSFNYKQVTIYEKNIKIFPKISIENINQIFIEGEKVKAKLKSSHPCFYVDGSYVNQDERTIGTAKLVYENGKVKSESCEDEIFLSGVDSYFKLNFNPKVLGFRFERKSDNSIYQNKLIKYNDIDNYRLIINGIPENKGYLSISDLKKEVKLDQSGNVKINLEDIKSFIYNSKTYMKIKQDHREIEITIDWQPNVFNINQLNNEITDTVKFKLDYEGPRNTSLWFEAVDSSARFICKYEVKCIGKRVIKDISIELPQNYNSNEIVVYGYFSPDGEDSFAELSYRVSSENKTLSEDLEGEIYLQSEKYIFNDFISDMERISSLTKKFAKKEFLIGD